MLLIKTSWTNGLGMSSAGAGRVAQSRSRPAAAVIARKRGQQGIINGPSSIGGDAIVKLACAQIGQGHRPEVSILNR
ncbi:hypothetical protein [Bradyrhizobium ivorense]|uniref:hypothetical protein n=1 Tax=Bradyrhizobium ivorense TaxID=2511166 RepID=UPI001E2F69CA|nr:hypothetical protein [Bradyrhizobium ivorense]